MAIVSLEMFQYGVFIPFDGICCVRECAGEFPIMVQVRTVFVSLLFFHVVLMRLVGVPMSVREVVLL